jgi:hypothetical protein
MAEKDLDGRLVDLFDMLVKHVVRELSVSWVLGGRRYQLVQELYPVMKTHF